MLKTAQILEQLRDRGYYVEDGHFLLSSQQHSDSYIHLRVALMDEDVAGPLAAAMADRAIDISARVIAASSIGGLLLAKRVAQLRNLPLLIGRQVGRQVEWRNATEFSKSELGAVMLIDDVLTTGATLRPAITALEEIGAKLVDIGVALDRSPEESVSVTVGKRRIDPFGLVPVSLHEWTESECRVCSTTNRPIVDLSNPDEDYLSVLLSMPSSFAEQITAGYRGIYILQEDSEQLRTQEALLPWISSLLAGLPKWRVSEDSGLVQFIRGVTAVADNEIHRRVLIELVGHLIAVANVRVESRSLGCSVVIGDAEKLSKFFAMDAPLKPPPRAARASVLSNFGVLLPYFDALLETENVFVFDRSGYLVAIKHLARLTESHQSRGTQLLREVTGHGDAVALLVRRGRKALYVYRAGKLTNSAELSEKSGIWEFSSPGPIVADIESELPGITGVLETVLEVCREMVTRGYGGLFVVGKRSASLRHEPPKVQVAPQPLRFLGTGEAAEIAKLDGAVFVSRAGEIERASIIITNADTRNVETASRRVGGARSQAAHRTSVECPDAAVVLVSQNGTIEVYVRGRPFSVARAITGVLR